MMLSWSRVLAIALVAAACAPGRASSDEPPVVITLPAAGRVLGWSEDRYIPLGSGAAGDTICFPSAPDRLVCLELLSPTGDALAAVCSMVPSSIQGLVIDAERPSGLDAHLRHMPSLELLDLGGAGTTSLAGVAAVVSLRVLIVGEYVAPDSAIAEIRALPLLTDLRLAGSHVHSQLDSLVGSLVTLDVAGVREFADSDLASTVGRHGRTLVRLNLSGTTISAVGLRSISGAIALKRLDLSQTSIGDQDLAALKDCLALEALKLTASGVGDKAVLSLRGHKALKVLSLMGCSGVTDASVETLRSFSRLSSLDLSGTSISSVGVKSLGVLQELEELWLPCRLEPADREQLAAQLPKCTLHQGP